MKILLTYFEPFGGRMVNNSAAAVKGVLAPKGVELVKLSVPVTFEGSGATVIAAMEALTPDAVICVGEAGGRSEITPERVAINVDDARIPDNHGAQPIDRPITPGGAPAYFSTLPIKAMVAALSGAGIPAQISNSAGTYVCNHLMYRVLEHLHNKGANIPAGFIHVPAGDVVDTELLSRGLEICINQVISIL